jgi:hypothetical protein
MTGELRGGLGARQTIWETTDDEQQLKRNWEGAAFCAHIHFKAVVFIPFLPSETSLVCQHLLTQIKWVSVHLHRQKFHEKIDVSVLQIYYHCPDGLLRCPKILWISHIIHIVFWLVELEVPLSSKLVKRDMDLRGYRWTALRKRTSRQLQADPSRLPLGRHLKLKVSDERTKWPTWY